MSCTCYDTTKPHEHVYRTQKADARTRDEYSETHRYSGPTAQSEHALPGAYDYTYAVPRRTCIAESGICEFCHEPYIGFVLEFSGTAYVHPNGYDGLPRVCRTQKGD